MTRKLFFLICLITATYSCDRDTKESTGVFIGGEIMNPNSPYVIISKNDIEIDTFYLNDKNQFEGRLSNIESGLYTFRHPPENQVMYLEPGDSLMVFLNTYAFDESINFSGIGAERTNFLTNLYLLNQKNNDLILTYYKLEPSEFALKTDSIKAERVKRLDELEDKIDFSDEFYTLAQASINYEFYDLRERYTFLIYKYYNTYKNRFPDDFFDYRNDISFNDEQLKSYYVYLNLLDDYLKTKSIEDCTTPSCLNTNSFENVKKRITMVDSLIKIPSLRNLFLDRLAAQSIIFSNDTQSIISTLELLEEIEYDSPKKADLRQMAGIHNSLLPGKNMGNLSLTNINKDTVQLNSLLKTPIISYNWSIYSPEHHRWQHGIIDNLRKKYPEVRFIGVNIDKDVYDVWKNTIEANGYPANHEFQISYQDINRDLLKNYLNKLFFINKDGVIIRGDAQINTPDFESKILEFVSQ